MRTRESIAIAPALSGFRRLTVTAAMMTIVTLLSACSTPRVVDDGRFIDSAAISQARDFGHNLQEIRIGSLRSSALAQAADPQATSLTAASPLRSPLTPICDTYSYHLPFLPLTALIADSDDTRIALLRALGVNETLKVLWSQSPAVPIGSVIEEVDGTRGHGMKLLTEINLLTLNGKPVPLALKDGKKVTIHPVKTCRGVTIPAPPGGSSEETTVHWTSAIVGRAVMQSLRSAEEWLYLVLWEQGYSEEGATAMRTVEISTALVGLAGMSALTVAGVGAAGASAANAAATAATSRAVLAAAAQATLTTAAARAAAGAIATGTGNALSRYAGSTQYDKADAWAAKALCALGGDPATGLRVHQQLSAQNIEAGPFRLDADRLKALEAVIAKLSGCRKPGRPQS